MKTPSRNLIIAASGAALLLLAGLLGLQQTRRQNNIGNERFNDQYSKVIKQLRGIVDSGQKKMKRNEVAIPTLAVLPNPALMAVADPDPVRLSVDKDRTFVLQGISWSETRPLVMIDDKVYKTGDQIGGYTIQQISPQDIILRDSDGAQKKINLIKEVRP